MRFQEAMDAMLSGALVRQHGTKLPYFYDKKKGWVNLGWPDKAVAGKDTWTNSEVFGTDWEIVEREEA